MPTNANANVNASASANANAKGRFDHQAIRFDQRATGLG